MQKVLYMYIIHVWFINIFIFQVKFKIRTFSYSVDTNNEWVRRKRSMLIFTESIQLHLSGCFFYYYLFMGTPLYLPVYWPGIPEIKNWVYFTRSIPTLITYQIYQLFLCIIILYRPQSEQPFYGFRLRAISGAPGHFFRKHRWHVHVVSTLLERDNIPKHVNNCRFSARATHNQGVKYVSFFIGPIACIYVCT